MFMEEIGQGMSKMRSPCIQVCQLDETEHCIGCGRSKTEIINWTFYTERERDAIMQKLKTLFLDKKSREHYGHKK